MQEFLIILICAAAVWYLYRHFSRALKTDQGGCGCGTCKNCPASNKEIKNKKGKN